MNPIAKALKLIKSRAVHFVLDIYEGLIFSSDTKKKKNLKIGMVESGEIMLVFVSSEFKKIIVFYLSLF